MTVNILSFDIEHWYESFIYRRINNWKNTPYSDAKTVENLIDKLQNTKNSATFFVTGRFAAENKSLIKKAHSSGIEIASHSFDHKLLTNMTKREIHEDLKRSKFLLEDITGDIVRGFRAPKWSVNYENRDLIYDILINLGFTYDSSIFPFNFSDGDLKIEKLQKFSLKGKDLFMIPVTTKMMFGLRVPQGGFYFRILPFKLTESTFKQNETNKEFNHLFLHPYDIDPDVPWIKKAPISVNIFKKFNTKGSLINLGKLLLKFNFIGTYDYISSNSELNRYKKGATK